MTHIEDAISRLRGAIQISAESEFGDGQRDLRIVTIRLDDAELLLGYLSHVESPSVEYVYQAHSQDSWWYEIPEGMYLNQVPNIWYRRLIVCNA